MRRLSLEAIPLLGLISCVVSYGAFTVSVKIAEHLKDVNVDKSKEVLTPFINN